MINKIMDTFIYKKYVHTYIHMYIHTVYIRIHTKIDKYIIIVTQTYKKTAFEL